MSAVAKDSSSILKITAWIICIGVITLAVIAWGQSLSWRLTHRSIYQIFPVLGLIAFSTMWSQYIAGALGKVYEIPEATLSKFFQITGFIVLAAICLHPSLLVWQLWRDGQGLPPSSYEHVYGPATLLGTAGLLIFLFYELRRWLYKKSWWNHVHYLVDVAMLIVFYHSLKLGATVQGGWFRVVWLFYGTTLIMALLYTYQQRLFNKKPAGSV